MGAAIYDMYFGEAFCAALPGFEPLYGEILDYAYRELKDGSGLGVAICDKNKEAIEAVKAKGFVLAEQKETVMKLALDRLFPVILPEGFRFEDLDPVRESYDYQWLLWQGFDHGEDRAEFERTLTEIPENRRHFDLRLSVAAVDQTGDRLAYCCLWYRKDTDYAYVEPVCTVPAARGKGLARAVLFKTLNRARALGAEGAYVISDQVFYAKLGFEIDRRYSFYWKK